MHLIIQKQVIFERMCNKAGCLFLRLMKMKMKNSSNRYDVIRPKPRYGHKYANDIKSVSVRWCLCILSNTLREKCPNMEFFSGPYFPAFGLNTDRYRVSLRIQSEYGKIRTRKSSVFGQFSHSDTWGTFEAYWGSSLKKHWGWTEKKRYL